ncbi:MULTISPECIES: hypothetical protein [unclassified Pseudoalteromonas]|uniref:hypothetical protein n=1 Tax=unclassified Pseudoalteromonas TaxID=194690 RepID=UPI001F0F3EFE|nr:MULTISPECIES: hypothetical protein [unclassified Pseudoalteromonas]WMS91946.1 hypothetical protein RB214_05985 [Pseudoalteromonas sp. HL-AS1]
MPEKTCCAVAPELSVTVTEKLKVVSVVTLGAVAVSVLPLEVNVNSGPLSCCH